MKASLLNTLNDGELFTIQFKVNEDFDGDIENLVIVEDDVKITTGEDMLTVPVSIQNVGMIKAHNYGAPVVTEPDCTNPGTAKYVCACGDEIVYVDSTKPALGHNEATEWVVKTPATCTTAGLKTKSCTECGVELSSEEIPAIGHNYGAWSVKTGATDTANGEANSTCSNCGDVLTVVIPKLSLAETSWTQGAESSGLSFTTGAAISSVSVNGKALSKDNYVINGSTVLLKADYLDTLEEGNYELTITSAYDHEYDGLDKVVANANVSFNVVAESSAAVIIIIIVIAVVLVGVVATVVVLKKKELI
jgi:hypothetical protein